MPACPASFLEERFPTSLPTGQAGGNDTTCAIIYDAVYKYRSECFINSGLHFSDW